MAPFFSSHSQKNQSQHKSIWVTIMSHMANNGMEGMVGAVAVVAFAERVATEVATTVLMMDVQQVEDTAHFQQRTAAAVAAAAVKAVMEEFDDDSGEEDDGGEMEGEFEFEQQEGGEVEGAQDGEEFEFGIGNSFSPSVVFDDDFVPPTPDVRDWPYTPHSPMFGEVASPRVPLTPFVPHAAALRDMPSLDMVARGNGSMEDML